jgi:hypothetical protein
MRTALALILTAVCVLAQLGDPAFVASLQTPDSQVVAYYVDSVAGSDANSGLSFDSAFASLAKVTSVTGATNIYLKRGSMFRESLLVPTNGTVNAYGTGAKPIISGAVLLTNASFSLTSGKTYTYEYSIDAPIETNVYVSLTHSNILMVWENDSRLGIKWDANAGSGSTAAVEANAGSFWYDRGNNKLYIHPADNGNPVTNGKTYEASVRTLAVHGGDNVYVANLQAEKAYARSTTGQQGYQFMAHGGGTYYKCFGLRGWNHIIGVANTNSQSLTFDSCYAADMEPNIQLYLAGGTLFVAYRDPATGTASVTFTNCLAAQPGAGYNQEFGFYAHDSEYGTPVSVSVQYKNCTVSNVYHGFNWSTNISEITAVKAVQCYNGVYGENDNIRVTDSEFYYCTNGVFATSSTTNTYVSGSKFTEVYLAAIQAGTSANDKVTAINNLIARSGTVRGYGIDCNGKTNKFIVSTGNTFRNFDAAYLYGRMDSGSVSGNRYYGLNRFGAWQAPSPELYSSWEQWTNAWPGIDSGATFTDPNYDAGWYTTTVSDPTQ